MADNGQLTWDDLQRIIDSGSKDKKFIERGRETIVMRETGHTIEEMTQEDLDTIIKNGCRDQELIDRVERKLRSKK